MENYTFIRKDIIIRQVIIEGIVETQSPLRIGAGESAISIGNEQPVLKTTDGKPIIPGSSWKGVFRSTGERILRNKGIEVCSGIGKDYCLNNRHMYKCFQEQLRKYNINEALKIFWEYTCLNCKTFGTMSVIGAVKFLDSYPISYKLATRTMVAISRTEGAAAYKSLVTVEYVEPGSTFTFRLIGNNLPNYVIGYLVSIMKEIHDGLVQIGGFKSRGFGFIKFKELNFISIGANKIGNEDKEVNLNNVRGKGDEFFDKMQPYIEVFNNVKLPYPKSTIH